MHPETEPVSKVKPRLLDILLPLVLLPFCGRADGVAEHPGPGGDAARSDAAVDTVIVVDKVQVTAIKQGPVLRSTAVASSIIGSRAVERSGVSALKEVALTVPNFHAPDYGSRITSSIYVRGLGARIDQPVIGMK